MGSAIEACRLPARLVARLEFLAALGDQPSVELPLGTTSVGRLDTNDVRLSSPAVSKRHAEIVWREGQFRLRDLGSRNGTFVNDGRLGAGESRLLAHGDRLRFGGHNAPEGVFRLGDQANTPDQSSSVLLLAPVFAQALRALRPGHGLTEVLEVVLDSSLVLSGAGRGFVMLAEGGALTFGLGRTADRRSLTLDQFATTSRAIPQQVLSSGEPFFAADLLATDFLEAHDRTVQLGVRSVVCLPLLAARFSERDITGPSRRIGVLYMDGRSPGRLLSPTTRAALETLTAEAALALEHTLMHRELLVKERLEQDLARAAEIQQALLPPRQCCGDYFSLAASIQACRTIGGDFFGYLERPDVFHLLVGDVAGKGTAAALEAALLQGVFAVDVSRIQGPAEAVADINGVLCQRVPSRRMATLFCAALSPRGQLSYCNAGHCPPLLVRRHGVYRLGVGGVPAGAFPDAPYEHESLTLEAGDAVLIFTDGVTEASADPAGEGEQYGDHRLPEIAADLHGMTPVAFIERLRADLDAYTNGVPQADDVTAVVLRYLG